MRYVQHAAVYPHRCAVIPFVTNSSTRYGFIDSGMDLPGRDPHVYLSGEAVLEAMKVFGFDQPTVSPEVDRLKARVAELERELAEADRQLDAVQVLKQAGYSAQRKPGPKKAVA